MFRKNDPIRLLFDRDIIIMLEVYYLIILWYVKLINAKIYIWSLWQIYKNC